MDIIIRDVIIYVEYCWLRLVYKWVELMIELNWFECVICGDDLVKLYLIRW